MSGAVLLQSGLVRQWCSTNLPVKSASDHKTESNEVNSRCLLARRFNDTVRVRPLAHSRNSFFAFSKRIFRSATLFGARRRITAIVCEPEHAEPEPTRSSQSLP